MSAMNLIARFCHRYPHLLCAASQSMASLVLAPAMIDERVGKGKGKGKMGIRLSLESASSSRRLPCSLAATVQSVQCPVQETRLRY